MTSADIDGATVTPDMWGAAARKVEPILYAMIDVVMDWVIGACDQRQGKARDRCIDETLLFAFENDGAMGRNCKRSIWAGLSALRDDGDASREPPRRWLSRQLIDWSDLEDINLSSIS